MRSGPEIADPTARALAVRKQFHDRFGDEPARIVRGPGRVNLIGEHTDYNDGFVLPLAIDFAVWVALRPRPDAVVRVWSMDFNEGAEFPLDSFSHGSPQWAEYVKGVAWALTESGYVLRGWEGVIAGDVPIGAGLSSSAALEVACARAFADVAGFEWDAVTMARIAQAAENRWIGVQCGIMDQLAATSGREGHAILIDCRSLEISTVPLLPGTRVVVLDTGTRRDLSSSAYNERRQECEAAARAFGVPALRDLAVGDLSKAPAGLSSAVLRRARHVVTENNRVLEMAEAMRRGDRGAVGALMRESHRSLREDFEASTEELDVIVACAERAGSIGARMTGAGFGGCAVALVPESSVGELVERAVADYERVTGRTARAYVCRASEGATSKGGLEAPRP